MGFLIQNGMKDYNSVKAISLAIRIRHLHAKRLNTLAIYLLYQLKKQGLAMSALNVIFKALVVSRIEYAPHSFSGFLSRTDMDRLNALPSEKLVDGASRTFTLQWRN